MTGHGHGHDHGAGTATGRHRRRLIAVLAVSAGVFVLQVIGGLLSGSLALLADAGHVLTDSTGLIIALIAASLAARPATPNRTFGLQRVEILAALSNGLLLVGIAVWVLIQAVQRWSEPEQVDSDLMLGVAVVGAVANTAGLLILRGGKDESLNLRGAYLEVLGDLIGSIAVIVAAVVIAVTGWVRADAVASLAIVVLILPRAWSLLRDVVDVLLEAAPKGVDLAMVREHIRTLPGVVDVHDLHAWTITSGVPVLSAHVVVDDACLAEGRSGEVLDRLGECLGHHFDVEHCTFQLEPVGHAAHEGARHA
ncbi:cation efflux protein [Microlunatus phosphovorus NM-1]|uniref:Cation efflux protein n=1 Tax=Microlunatus phosphovorus (strain ATCC 700054 / DSM 10555 / JCM 9379 / NBRC 101784 / NCIMB 13414 / VKM Ac-1990 / NM-1) TaxID=1032480 RepID=F5XHC5_MICPN|nr:cation diffusion facilitator family transporter [Microlunatus phosphovorus]BAK38133.1 cation efflux protein [Microlunatus phosphovorus NM-1]